MALSDKEREFVAAARAEGYQDSEITQRLLAHRGEAPPASVAVDATRLSPTDEKKYQAWKTTLPDRLRYEGDYDLRGFWKKNPTFSVDVPGQHMTDEFKLPNHPTFSNESRYYNDKTKHLGGHWMGDVYIPNDTRFKQMSDESEGASPSDPPPPWLTKSAGPAIAPAAAPLGGATKSDVPATAPETPGVGRSLWEGFKKTMGLGFGDELGGALERAGSLLSGKGDTSPSMAEETAALRSTRDAATAAHPFVTGLGSGIGMAPLALMAPAAAAAGAAPAIASAPLGLGARMASGALAGYGQGAIQGAGDSDAPDLAGRVAGAEQGGNIGAAVGAGLPLAGAAVGKVASKLVEGAPARVAARVRDAIGEGAGAKATGKLMQKADEVDALVAEHPEIEKAASNPKKLLDIAEKGVEKDQGRLVSLLEAKDAEKGHGIRLGDVLSNLTDAWAKASADPEGQAVARAIEKKQSDVISAWGNDPETFVPSATVRKTGSALQREGFGASLTAEETANRTAAQEASKAVLDTVTKHVTGMDFAGARASSDPDVAAYFKLNDQLTAWHRVEGAAKVRANAKAGQGGRLTKLVHGATDAGAFALSAGMHSPVPFIAEQALTRGVPMAARAADRALARIAVAKQAGAVSPALVKQALAAGARAETIQQLVGGGDVAAAAP